MAKHVARSEYRTMIAAVTVLIFAAGAAGCGGSAAKPKPTDTAFDRNGERNSQLIAVMGACFVKHHVIPQSDIQYVPKKNGQVDTTSNEFRSVFSAYGSFVKYQNRSWSDWINQANWNGTWPTSLCGPMPSLLPKA